MLMCALARRACFTLQAVETSDSLKFVNELFGLGGNCTVYRPPPRDTSGDGDGDEY